MKDRIKVYLLGGQSNMCGVAPVEDLPVELKDPQPDVIIFARGELDAIYNGEVGWRPVQPALGADATMFGPEITFARDMAAANPGEKIALLKCAWGGTNLMYQWRPPSSGGKTGELYTRFVAAVREGIAALDPQFEPIIAGMIWMQGEADALEEDMYADYEQNLVNFINDMRTEVQTSDLPFVLAQIKDCETYAPPKWGAEVRLAQSNVGKNSLNTAVFDTSDYNLIDPWHYDAPGMLSLGSRFARAMLGLEKN